MNEKDLRSLRVRRIALTVLCAVLAFLIAVLIGAVAYTQILLNRMNYESPAPSPQETETAALQETELPALKIEAVDTDFAMVPPVPAGSEIVNILLIGQDRGSDNGARSDCMILCTFNRQKKTITMTSFLRDLYVKIPGHGKNRINAAYSFGGTELLEATLCENFGVEVDGYLQVDFNCFREIIDTLGGVSMELTGAEARYIKKHAPGSTVTEGTNLLCGKEALIYARDRNDVDGDFSRTSRQRKLLGALIREYKDEKPTRMLALLGDILPLVTTDIAKPDLITYAVTLFPMLTDAEVITQAVPFEGTYTNATIDKMAVLVPDLEKNRQALADSLT